MPYALSLLNVNDACHLEHLMWVVYDRALLVGRQPELPGNHQWCTMLAGFYKHIYRGRDDTAHCPPQTLASWDYQERTGTLSRGESWVLRGVATGEHPGPGEDLGAAPDATPRCQLLRIGADTPAAHCPTLPRCHCGEPLSPGVNTTPKLPSAVNIPAYTRSSH